jgi:hypothetical protein
MVNASRQEFFAHGRVHLFETGPFVQTLEISAEDAYPGVADLYRRTLLLVDVAPDQAYVVDIFRVRGGSQHDWVAHGVAGDFSAEPPLSDVRKEGTLAGPDVAYGEFYDDPRFADDNRAHVPYTAYRGSGFQWLFNVQQGALRDRRIVQWQRGKVMLRTHLLNAHPGDRGETVFACDGVPQRRKPFPDTVKFVLRRRTGDALESVYVTVFEMAKENPFIDAVRLLPAVGASDGLPVALEVKAGGTRHVVFSRLDNGTATLPLGEMTLDARMAALEWTEGDLSRACVLGDADSKGLPCRAAVRQATVASVDYGRGLVTLAGPALPAAVPENTWAVVESPRHANAVPVAGILGPTVFSVGDDDLYAGLVHVQSVQGRRISFRPRYGEWPVPGMSVVNERGTVVGRLTEVGSGTAVLLEDVGPHAFPDADGDGKRSCRFVVVGPGDTVRLHCAARWEAE